MLRSTTAVGVVRSPSRAIMRRDPGRTVRARGRAARRHRYDSLDREGPRTSASSPARRAPSACGPSGCSRRRASTTRRSTCARADIQARRQAWSSLTGRYTVPQILIDETPIGGYDELKALDDAGRLDPHARGGLAGPPAGGARGDDPELLEHPQVVARRPVLARHPVAHAQHVHVLHAEGAARRRHAEQRPGVGARRAWPGRRPGRPRRSPRATSMWMSEIASCRRRSRRRKPS